MSAPPTARREEEFSKRLNLLQYKANVYSKPYLDEMRRVFKSLEAHHGPDIDDLIAHLFACRREEEALRQTETSASTWTYE